jgi:polyisoprenoid-binding protein YceI
MHSLTVRSPSHPRHAIAACALFIAALASAAVAIPAEAAINLAKSAITATSKQMNVPVEGKFKKFTGNITFDPAKPAAGSAQFDVDVASYDLGDDGFNAEVRGKEWFDAGAFPHASFRSSTIVPAGDGRYSVTGKLTIKGKTADVVVPVTYAQQGATQTFTGMLPIKRSQFAIGTGEWAGTSVVADEVTIKFTLVATKP